MAEKTFGSRFIQTHDTAANWLKTNFIPKCGEIIIYDIDADHDYERFKIGDGKTNINALPFSGAVDSVNGKTGDVVLSAVDVGAATLQDMADTLKYYSPNTHNHDDEYYTKSEADAALANSKAYTDKRFDDALGDYATVQEHIEAVIDEVTLADFGVTATANELNKLDGVTATNTELNYVHGVTSNIQNQLDEKAASGHTHSTYANQNAFSNVKVGSTTITADVTTDTLTLAGSNVTLTPDATNDKVTIGITKENVVAALGYTPPTTDTKVTVDSELSDTSTNPVQNKIVHAALYNLVGDKTVQNQIDEAIASKADTVHTHDDRYYTESEVDSKLNGKLSLSGGTLTGNLTLDNSATTQPKKPYVQWAAVGGNKPYTGLAHDQSDGTFIICSMEKDTTTHGEKYYKNGLAIGGGSGNLFWKGSKIVTVDDAASQSAAGLMSASDKKKLDGIATGATKVTVDSALSSTSTNPVQNKIVNAAISNLNTLVGDTTVATQISNAVAKKADSSHIHDDRYYTETEINTKLSGKSDTSHTHSAYVNQNAFSNVTIGSTTIAAASATDTLTLVGSNVTLTPDATNDKVTIGITKANVVAALGYTPPTTDTKVTVDSALSSTSTNPVQNKVVNAAISSLNTLVGDTAVATQISNAVATKADSGHTHSSYVNQNAFSNVKVGSTTVAADSTTDTLTLAGSNVTITPDATNDKITIGITKDNVTAALGYTPPTTNTTYSAAGSSLGLVKSGGDVTISSGVITVNDDSHNHVISNIDGLSEQLALIGDTAVATQISNAIASKADSSHTHDDRYYTESEINTKLNGKANASHGNHVPTVETANNAKFLRNDNTWQTVTPANIGAAASSHGTHVSYSTTSPVMDGTASAGSASTVARSDHKHPTDTSRASASDLSALQTTVSGKANASHKHVVADISNIVISATQPSSPTAGMLWFDIS